MIRVAVTLSPAAFGLPSPPDLTGPTFEFDLVDASPDLAACELAFAICNSSPDELFCPQEFAPVVADYRARRLRSLSVGDTVALTKDGVTRHYRVASFGFERAHTA
jgi:hypothetical protein